MLGKPHELPHLRLLRMNSPLAIDLYCGLGGWTEGLLAEGYYVVGFDIERHRYARRTIPRSDSTKLPVGNSTSSRFSERPIPRISDLGDRSEIIEGEWDEYPAQLVIQNVLTLHGKQFKDAALIVASPPCQAYSYRAMPWKRAKALPPPDNSLFEACFRIQREAIEAAGHFIPLVVENVRGAQKWVGRARWNFGSFYLWGDVPALMPMVKRRNEFYKCPNESWSPSRQSFTKDKAWKNNGGSWFAIGSPGQKELSRNPVHEGMKIASMAGNRTAVGNGERFTSLKGSARKAASAAIAKIPFVLARHIAQAWYPLEAQP